jgi:hypothetical protein
VRAPHIFPGQLDDMGGNLKTHVRVGEVVLTVGGNAIRKQCVQVLLQHSGGDIVVPGEAECLAFIKSSSSPDRFPESGGRCFVSEEQRTVPLSAPRQ